LLASSKGKLSKDRVAIASTQFLDVNSSKLSQRLRRGTYLHLDHVPAEAGFYAATTCGAPEKLPSGPTHLS
jgi:hypothetical protein